MFPLNWLIMDKADLNRLLTTLAELDGSDLHIKAGSPPKARIAGVLRPMEGEPACSPNDTEILAYDIMPANAAEKFTLHHEADFAYSVPGVGRFRVNAYRQRGSAALAMRRVRTSVSSIEELGLPDTVLKLADEQRGLVLVTGPTGSGKTTTLATMIDHINNTRSCHVITIEDPVEYLHRDRLASIDQREVGIDTDSFIDAMRVALRQDPDVILVGEIRDPETIYAALTAAETGHLVLSTLHTVNATATINRIVDFFPPHQQSQIRVSLAETLKGIICQRLVPKADGTGRVPALEVMISNGRIQQCIVDPLHTSDISQIITEGEYYGMRSFDQSLAELLKGGTISLPAAMASSSNPHDLKVMLERMGILSSGRMARG